MERHWQTCLHESAHGLYCLSAGLTPESISVQADGGGEVRAAFQQLSAADRCIMAMVGASAVDLLMDDPNHEGAHMSPEDQSLYNRARGELCGPAADYGKRFSMAAERFVREHATGIRAVAAALAEKRRMKPADLAAVIHREPTLWKYRQSIPKPSPPKLQPVAHRPRRPPAVDRRSIGDRAQAAMFGTAAQRRTEMADPTVASLVRELERR